MAHICFSESGEHWLRKWLVAHSAPSHYLNQCCVIINWALWNKLQWNFNQKGKLFRHENTYDNIVCEMSTILCWGRRVKSVKKYQWSIFESVIEIVLLCEQPEWRLVPLYMFLSLKWFFSSAIKYFLLQSDSSLRYIPHRFIWFHNGVPPIMPISDNT